MFQKRKTLLQNCVDFKNCQRSLLRQEYFVLVYILFFVKGTRSVMSSLVFRAILVVLLHTGSSEFVQRSALFDTKENCKVDVGAMIKRQTTRSLVSCTQECLAEPLCTSFNYDGKTGEGVCELYEEGNGMVLTQEPGWLCGRLLERNKIVERKSIKRCCYILSQFRDAKGKFSKLVATFSSM